MSNRSKGSNAERELLRIFTEHGWRAVRVAGSGVNDDSPADLIVGKIGKRGFTIEAKSSKNKNIYIKKQQVEDFILFSNIIGLKPVIAARFNHQGWIFLNPEQLKNSGKNWVINLKTALAEGKKFSQFFEN